MAVLVIPGLKSGNDKSYKTTVDTFAKQAFATVKYVLQFIKDNEYYSSELTVLNDTGDLHASESNIVSNTENNLANVSFEENAGIISLCVTPVISPVTVRYYRTALKQ